jgi:hypothetical protein
MTHHLHNTVFLYMIFLDLSFNVFLHIIFIIDENVIHNMFDRISFNCFIIKSDITRNLSIFTIFFAITGIENKI